MCSVSIFWRVCTCFRKELDDIFKQIAELAKGWARSQLSIVVSSFVKFIVTTLRAT